MRKILSLLFALSLFCYPVLGDENWNAGGSTDYPRGTINPGTVYTEISNNMTIPLDRLLANYREGCTITYASASTLTVTSGEVTVSNSSGSIRLFQRNTGNTSVSWSDIDTGAEANSTTYYVYAVVSSVTDSTFTIKISTSSTSPSGITYYKKLGNFYNNSSGNIEQIENDNTSVSPDYDSGWFTATNTTLYTKAHGISISFPSDIIEYDIYWRASSGGSYIVKIGSTQTNDDNPAHPGSTYDGTNFYIKSYGAWGYYITSGGTFTLMNNGELRIIAKRL